MKQDAGAARRIYYTLHSGKNSKLAYYIAGTARTLVPKWLLRPLLRGRLASLQSRADRDYILDRVGYYCKLDAATDYDHDLWRDKSVRVADQQKGTQKVYYLDAMRYARWFPQTLR